MRPFHPVPNPASSAKKLRLGQVIAVAMALVGFAGTATVQSNCPVACPPDMTNTCGIDRAAKFNAATNRYTGNCATIPARDGWCRSTRSVRAMTC